MAYSQQGKAQAAQATTRVTARGILTRINSEGLKALRTVRPLGHALAGSLRSSPRSQEHDRSDCPYCEQD
jgi:hypothetical protein